MIATLLTSLALLAFAANSILCRMALGSGAIDAASFTLIRLASGALVLVAITWVTHPQTPIRRLGRWRSALYLGGYALTFSLAYVQLDTGTGALVLFGLVQLTMLGGALRRGERPDRLSWCGYGLAMVGLTWLLWPGATMPSWSGAILMSLSGIAWGLYSLSGRESRQPLLETTGHFLRALLVTIPCLVVWHPKLPVQSTGVILAMLSGGLASGCGYVIWYRALRSLQSSQAAVVQLAVPVLAAGGGVLFLGEQLTPRLLIAALLVLGGIGLAVSRRD